MDRTQELLKHITKDQRGIEIAPYHNPLVPRRLGYNSLSLDVFDTAELRRRAEGDPNIPREHLPLIEEVAPTVTRSSVPSSTSPQHEPRLRCGARQGRNL
jgi:hypothetical protein